MLSLFASIYGKVANVRNRLYDRGVLESFDLGTRTISIGNITTGGTGKTPLVAHVAEFLAASGEQVCILTRGYGRKNANKRVLVSDGDQIFADPSESGDEPFELAQKLRGKIVVIADADRVAAAAWAKRKYGVSAFIMDDGFQHRKVKRDVDIVCIDTTDPFGGGKILPSGRLREPWANLKRADIVVLTRANLAEDLSDLKSHISDINVRAKIFEAKNKIVETVSLEEFYAKAQSKELSGTTSAFDKGRRAFAFCGIGNPANFFEQLRREGFSLVASRAFRDHHNYTQQEIIDIEKCARESGAESLLTTAKDAVKLSYLKFELSCFVVEIRMSIDDAKTFAAML